MFILFEVFCFVLFLYRGEPLFLLFAPWSGLLFYPSALTKRSYSLHKALAKTPNLALMIVDKNGYISFINKKFEQAFALKSKAVQGILLDDFFASVDELRGQTSFKALQDSSNELKSFTIKRGDSYLFLVLSSILEAGIHFEGLILTLYDVTQEKRREEEALQREKILLANAKMALVGEMISSITHQQRQPLSTLLLSLDNIEESIENSTKNIEKYILLAKNSAKIMNETINAFRSFYRNDTSTVIVDLKEILNELIFIITPELNSHGIAIKCHIQEGEYRLLSIKTYIKQILLSLLANANDELLECTKSGLASPHEANKFAPRVELRLYRQDEEFCISISDNGRGVCEPHRIFEPFYTTKSERGTGTGLYVAKRLSEEKLGARLLLQSERDPTCFTLYLAAKRGDF